MASAAFIEPLPVIEFVAQLLGKDVLSKPLSDSDRVKVHKSLHLIISCLKSLIVSSRMFFFLGIFNRLRRVLEE